MKAIIGSNSTGKTRQLIEYVGEHGGVIVCKHPAAMVSKAEAYGIYGIQCVTYHDYLYHNFSGNTVGYIDDLDAFMEAINCKGYTLTVD